MCAYLSFSVSQAAGQQPDCRGGKRNLSWVQLSEEFETGRQSAATGPDGGVDRIEIIRSFVSIC